MKYISQRIDKALCKMFDMNFLFTEIKNTIAYKKTAKVSSILFDLSILNLTKS